MRVFVTGASGFVGSAVVRELIGAGHQVLGVARSDAGAAIVEAVGAEVWRGDLQDIDGLVRGTEQADAVAHLAFNHDFSKWAENCEVDRTVIEALGAALKGSDRPLVVTSGMALTAPGQESNEDTPANSAVPRAASEQAVDALVAQGVKAMVLRLPPTTHGAGDHGFVPMLIGVARDKGAAAYVGEGLNLWPAGHRLDAAQLYRLVLEKGVAGRRYHAAAERGVAFRDIAGVIGRRLGLPVVSKTPEEAGAHFGWFAPFAGADVPSSSVRTRAETGWAPVQPGLIEDMEANYFEG